VKNNGSRVVRGLGNRAAELTSTEGTMDKSIRQSMILVILSAALTLLGGCMGNPADSAQASVGALSTSTKAGTSWEVSFADADEAPSFADADEAPSFADADEAPSFADADEAPSFADADEAPSFADAAYPAGYSGALAVANGVARGDLLGMEESAEAHLVSAWQEERWSEVTLSAEGAEGPIQVRVSLSLSLTEMELGLVYGPRMRGFEGTVELGGERSEGTFMVTESDTAVRRLTFTAGTRGQSVTGHFDFAAASALTGG
jgi:hypothetical protein